MTALLKTRDVARQLGCSPRTLERWRRAGIGPRFIRLPKRTICYQQEVVDAYVTSRIVASTSQRLEKHQ
jgi:transposase-like protein